MGALKKFIFWDYSRGSWQYDVMVGLILAFIFLTPKSFFRDYPKPLSISLNSQGSYWIDPQLLNGVPENQLVEKATALVNTRFKTHATITGVDPIYNDEQELQGYMAYTKP